MKSRKKVLYVVTMVLVAIVLTGCLSIDMKVGRNGSLDMTYTIDTSQTQGMVSFKDIEKIIEDSVNGMNDSAGKKVAKLKSVKENKGKKTVTAKISVSDINKMDEGCFFGTVKEYRKKNGTGLDNLVDTKDKSVDEKKVSDKLRMVSFSMSGTEQYGLVEVTVTVPGKIQYITNGGEIEKKNIAVFNGQKPLVVFRKSGGFPWLLLIIAVIVVAYFYKKKKSPSVAINTTPADGGSQPPVEASPLNIASQESPVQTSVQIHQQDTVPQETIIQDPDLSASETSNEADPDPDTPA